MRAIHYLQPYDNKTACGRLPDRAQVTAVPSDVTCPRCEERVSRRRRADKDLGNYTIKDDTIGTAKLTRTEEIMKSKMTSGKLLHETIRLLLPETGIRARGETMSLIFGECGHSGDLDIYEEDVVKSGGTVVSRRMLSGNTHGEITFTVANKDEFMKKFVMTQSADQSPQMLQYRRVNKIPYSEGMTVKELRNVIKEAIRPFGLSSGSGGKMPGRFDPQHHTIDDVMHAVMQEFAGVGNDLGVDDVKDPAFLDYIGTELMDRDVPRDVIQQIKQRLMSGKIR